MEQCRICGHEAWQIFEHLNFGVWQEKSGQLTRDTKDYPLGQCERCGHVQSLTEYSEALLQTLYFHGPQEQVFWHEQLVDSHFPYLQMVALFAEDLPKNPNITDLGCGTGSLLKACRNNFPNAQLTGVDFNDRCEIADIKYHSANIALADNLSDLITASSQDLVCASHTLEHLPDPRSFLLAAAKLLTSDGLLFIEVPDFTQPLNDRISGQSNLINLQHIHYFSETNLIALAKSVGLEPIKVERLTTGYIPRLQILMKSSGAEIKPVLENIKLDSSIRESIETARHHEINVRHQLIDKLNSALSNPENTVALWGIGSDAHLLIQEQEFLDLLRNPRLSLHDYQWAGNKLCGKRILGSDLLIDTSAKIFLLPSLAETRVKMHALAQNWGIEVIDPYTPDNFPLPTPIPCQLCQTDQWQHIETLNTGIWDKSNKALTRKNLAFPIGECHYCGHVQITQPHSEEDIAALYFSCDAQPEMWPVRTDGSNAYQEMVQTMGNTLTQASTVADFGCGEGLLLKEMQAVHPKCEYLGVDFNPLGDNEGIPRFKCDLNHQTALLTVATGKKFDLISASHVLEHLISPFSFLSALSDRLNDGGSLFIEVPNAGFNPNNRLHETNLIHGQHLHYFTQESILAFVAAVGLESIDYKELHTDSIPRLQLLLKKGVMQKLKQPLKQGATDSIKQRFTDYQQELALRAEILNQALVNNPLVGLWGIGGDCWQLLSAYPELIESIQTGRLIMFDRELAGHTLFGQSIQDSSQLADENLPVLIAPIYLPTASHMQRLATKFACKLL